jgi:hypothetical protein
MALRGMGVRRIFLALNDEQLVEGFAAAEPNVLLVYVESEAETD